MSGNDWRNVRIKDEPFSDVEGGGSRSRGYQEYGRRGGGGGERGRGGDDRRDMRRERHSPSPPPTHGNNRSGKPSRFSRSRSRSPKREPREGDSRDRSRNSRRERSRSWEREASYRDDNRDRRRPPSRDMERDRDRSNIRRVPKTEPRSRSSSPIRNPTTSQDRHRGGDDHQQRDERRNRGESSRERPRDGARERDWDNFFNPNSEMSKEAFVKREKEDKIRKTGSEDFGKKEEESEPPIEKEQPNFGLSGKLTEETNTFRGVVIKYSEPPESRKPNKIRWRLYPFKGQEALPVMYVHRQSAYLLGRDRKVADIPVDHPSCSKQHAVLQYRLVPYTRADGSKGRRIKPYIIDLESANGTYVNGNKIDPKRYVELFEKDVLKFGYSSREYVLLHDESKGIEDDAEAELTPD